MAESHGIAIYPKVSFFIYSSKYAIYAMIDFVIIELDYGMFRPKGGIVGIIRGPTPVKFTGVGPLEVAKWGTGSRMKENKNLKINVKIKD